MGSGVASLMIDVGVVVIPPTQIPNPFSAGGAITTGEARYHSGLTPITFPP